MKKVDALIVRFLQGNCSEEEKAQFLSWLNDDIKNEVLFFQMKEIFDTGKRFPLYEEQEIKTVYDTKLTIPHGQRLFFTSSWMRYAAVIVMILGASFVFYLLQHKQIFANSIVYVNQMVVHNSRGVYAVTLPDGSKVWLHGATTLTYPENFSDSIRMVDLEGEAYFSVHADETHPFVVQTSTAKVRATGTEFNVTAYPSDHMTTTTLVKGVVNIQPNHLSESYQLKPGQQAMTSLDNSQVHISTISDPDAIPAKISAKKEKPVIVKNINTELYTDWKEGVYRFKNEPFQNIVLRLEKMYGVSIYIENENLRNAFFSGMFTTDYSLKEAFEIINISQPISYTIKNKVVTIRNKSILN
jgi:ferric-dicitrate binding protein FerR (iron transport regulator)